MGQTKKQLSAQDEEAGWMMVQLEAGHRLKFYIDGIFEMPIENEKNVNHFGDVLCRDGVVVVVLNIRW